MIAFEWTRKALRSLSAVEQYVSDVAGVDTGNSLARKLFEKADKLIEFPRLGRAVPQFFDPRLREIIEGSYRIIYELNSVESPSQVSILGIVHHSQLLENHLPGGSIGRLMIGPMAHLKIEYHSFCRLEASSIAAPSFILLI